MKVTVAVFYFYHSKNSLIRLANIRNKCVKVVGIHLWGNITPQLQCSSFKIAIIIIYFSFIRSSPDVFLRIYMFLKNAANLQENSQAEV